MAKVSQRDVALQMRAHDDASKVIRAVGRNVRDLGKFSKLSSIQLFALGETARRTGQAFITMGRTAARGAGGAVRAAADFDQSMRLMQTQAKLPRKEYERLTEAILEMSTKAPQALNDFGEAAFDVFSSMFVNAREAQSLLKNFSKAATAGATDLRTASRGAIGVMNAFGMSAKDVTRVLDIQFRMVELGVGTYGEFASSLGDLLPSAVAAGQSFEEVAGALAFATRNGLSTSKASISLARALDALTHPKVKETLEEIGIEITDSKGNFKPLTTIIRDLRRELEGLTEAERIKALKNLFTGAGGDIRAMRFLKIAIPRFKDLKKIVKETGSGSVGALNRAFKEMSGSPAVQLSILRNNFQALAVTIGDILMPVAMELVSIVRNIIDWFRNLSPGVQKFIVTAVGLGAIILTIVGVFLTLFGAIASFISFMKLANIAWLSSVGALGVVIAVIAALVVIVFLVIKHWNTLKKVFILVWNKIKAFITPVIKVIKAIIIGAFVAIKTFFQVWWKVVTDIWKLGWKFLVTAFKVWWAIFGPLYKTIWNILKAIFKKYWEFLQLIWRNVGRPLVNILVSAFKWVRDNWVNIWSGLKKFLLGVWDGIKKAGLTMVIVILKGVAMLIGGLGKVTNLLKKVPGLRAIVPDLGAAGDAINTLIGSLEQDKALIGVEAAPITDERRRHDPNATESSGAAPAKKGGGKGKKEDGAPGAGLGKGSGKGKSALLGDTGTGSSGSGEDTAAKQAEEDRKRRLKEFRKQVREVARAVRGLSSIGKVTGKNIGAISAKLQKWGDVIKENRKLFSDKQVAQIKRLQNEAERLNKQWQKLQDRMKALRAVAAAGFESFGPGAIIDQLLEFGTGVLPSDVVTAVTDAAANARQFGDAAKALTERGFNNAFVNELISRGPEALPLMQALMDVDPALVNQAFREIAAQQRQVANALIESQLGPAIDIMTQRFQTFGQTLEQVTKGMIKTVKELAKKAGITLPGFASGGIIRNPTVAQLAERGPEVVIPLRTSAARQRALLEEAGLLPSSEGSKVVNLNLTGRMETPEQVVNAVEWSRRTRGW